MLRALKHKAHDRAFTLVEILIVVTILGILAAIVIPQFTNSSQEASGSVVASQLRLIRSQLTLYQARHGFWPALGTTGTEADWDILTNPADGDLSYLEGAPYNTFTGSYGIGTEDGTTIGWVYDQATGALTAPFFDEMTMIYNPPD